MRLAALCVLLSALFGCSAGGFVPHGPHSLEAATLERIVVAGAAESRLPPPLVRAMIAAESHGDPSAVSLAGARGLMQLMPATAATYGAPDAFDPNENVLAGCRYMRVLVQRYHNNLTLALAAYNAGPASVDAAHGIPPYPETRAYVARITAALHAST